MKKIGRGAPRTFDAPVADPSTPPHERADVAVVSPGSATLDTLFAGRLRISQSRTGYRFSLDALLLACFATVKTGEKIADLGTGSGVIPLMLAQRHPSASVLGIEVQESLAERARQNVRTNECGARVTIIHGDIRAVERLAPPESFAAVVCNPPYRKPSSGRLSPNTERRIARHEILGTLQDFIKAGVFLLAGKGRMAIVYPALRCVDALSALRNARIEPKRMRLVHSSSAAEASLVLVEGVKGGRTGIAILPPLFVYGPDRNYSPELEAMLQGQTRS